MYMPRANVLYLWACCASGMVAATHAHACTPYAHARTPYVPSDLVLASSVCMRERMVCMRERMAETETHTLPRTSGASGVLGSMFSFWSCLHQLTHAGLC